MTHHKDGIQVGVKPVGDALVVHRAGSMTDAAQAMAMALAHDPDHDLVVLDLPAEVPISVWEAVAAVLPRRRRGVRLVVAGRSRETAALAGHLLAQRLGRTVIAPDGAVVTAAGGALFVHSGPDSGWVRFRPGRPHRRAGKRFPPVSWECDAFADVVETSSTGAVEPLPCGLWLRPTSGDEGARDRHRGTLIGAVPTRPDVLTVVVGCPAGPPVSTDDVARLWLALPAELRPKVRFAPYGPVTVPPGRAFGAAFAQLINAPVLCYTGLPVGDAAAPDVVTVTPAGTAGWPAFARELRYPPPDADGEPVAPEIVDHRSPLPGMTACGPATYWYAPDAVVEVVPSGLLVRRHTPTSAVERIRAAAPDNGVNQIIVDPDEPRLRHLAWDLVQRLDDVTRRASRVLTTDEPSPPEPPPVSRPAGADHPPALLAAQPTEVVRPAIEVVTPTTRLIPAERTESIRITSAGPDPVRAQQNPSAEASALLPEGGIDKERDWLRRTLAARFDTTSDDVVRALEPVFGPPSADLVTDGVLIQLYLSPQGVAVDDALRSAATGPHVPIARSVLAGLTRLPSHQGATSYTTSMTAAQAEYYRLHPVVTDWSFRNALTGPAELPGDTDVLVWSVTGRRTAVLEPRRDGVPERVVFLPGTRFGLLDVVEPSGAARGLLMLRELAADEQGEPDVAGLDTMALDLLWERRGEWDDAGTVLELPVAAQPHFVGLPGLV